MNLKKVVLSSLPCWNYSCRVVGCYHLLLALKFTCDSRCKFQTLPDIFCFVNNTVTGKLCIIA